MIVGEFVKIKPVFADLVFGDPIHDSLVEVIEIEERGEGLFPLIHFVSSCGVKGALFTDAFEKLSIL